MSGGGEKRNELEGALARWMSPVRLAHAHRVAVLAAKLAARHGYDARKAYLAGLLHDLARDEEPSRLLQKAISFGIVKHEAEVLAPVVLHGPVAAAVAERELGVTDPEVLEAIALHTTGAPGMGGVAQAVYVADAVEPGRQYPEAAIGRRLAEQNLAQAVAFVAGQTMSYLSERGLPIDPRTQATQAAFASRWAAGGG